MGPLKRAVAELETLLAESLRRDDAEVELLALKVRARTNASATIEIHCRTREFPCDIRVCVKLSSPAAPGGFVQHLVNKIAEDERRIAFAAPRPLVPVPSIN